MPLINNNEDESGIWGRLSEHWPSTNKQAREKYVYLNMQPANSRLSRLVPYGSYVFIGASLRVETESLRVENDELLAKLNEAFEQAGSPTISETMERFYGKLKKYPSEK